MIIPRPYQSEILDAVREAIRQGKRRPLIVSPTGSGKTVMFAEITRGAAAKGNRIVIAAHRIELLDQISGALTDVDVEHGFVAADYPRSSRQTLVASVQTLIRRLDSVPEPQLIVCDEAHHAVANTWRTVLTRWPRAMVLGVTATPVRTSGAGLGEMFDTLILGPSVADLTAQGYLAPARVFAPPTMDTSGLHIRHGDFVIAEAEALANRPSVTGSALDEYRKRADGKRALAFCTSVKHAHDVAKQFREAGYSALALDGGTDRGIRRQAVADFKRGAIQVMSSADLFSEGFDSPGVEVGILLRPTASLGLFLQQIGRCLRTADGKTEALIFDHANNVVKFGMPDSPRQWSLEGEIREKRASPRVPCRICPNCWAANGGRARTCENCGALFPIQSREVDQREGELVELTAESIAKKRERQTQGMARTLEDLIRIEKRKRYKPGWALRVFNAREAKRRAKEAAETPSDAQLLVNLGGMIR